MRITIDIRKTRDAAGRKAVGIRTKYQSSGDDELRIHNCGVEIYNLIKEAFALGFEGGVVEHLGEVR